MQQNGNTKFFQGVDFYIIAATQANFTELFSQNIYNHERYLLFVILHSCL